MPERRRFERIPFNAPANLIVKETVYQTDSICNLSIGGCLFPLSDGVILKENETCQLTMPLNEQNDKVKITVIGEVIHCKQGMAGIKFLQLDCDSLFYLQNIIRYNADDPDKIEQEIYEHPGII